LGIECPNGSPGIVYVKAEHNVRGADNYHGDSGPNLFRGKLYEG
jgi:hypothetical protein